MNISTTQKNTYTLVMNMKKSKQILILLSILGFAGCTLSPGMYMETKKDFGDSTRKVFIASLGYELEVQEVGNYLVAQNDLIKAKTYKIGVADQIAVTIWGLPDVFPLTNINVDSNLRRVDSNGNIYFPYVGKIKASGKSQDELREDLTNKLSENFTNPQLDVSIAKFNSQKIYLLGEVTKPAKLNITDVPLSLSDALGEVNGLNTNTSSGSQVFVIRQGENKPEIFVADLSSPSAFIEAGNFFLQNNDIVYVNANNTTRWNRVISQFFPFSSFLTSIDRLVQD